MKKMAIMLREKVTYFHYIVVELDDDMSLESEQLEKIVENEDSVVTDFDDFVHMLKKNGVKVVETTESDDEWMREIEIFDVSEY